MCQSNAYFIEGNNEKLILEDVAKLLFENENKIRLISLFGEEKTVNGELEKVDLLNHKIFIKKV